MDALGVLAEVLRDRLGDRYLVVHDVEQGNPVLKLETTAKAPTIKIFSEEEAEAALVSLLKLVVPEAAWHPFIKAQHLGGDDGAQASSAGQTDL